MRLSLHTVICCCVFTTVLPPLKGATGEPNTSLKKRLLSHMKRELRNSLATVDELYSDIRGEPQKDGQAPPSSFGLNVRSKRSASSPQSGCLLVTCVYHDLFHRVYQMNNNQKEPSAPEKKISSKGYGRRRRSLPHVTQLALQTGRQGWSTEAGQHVRRHKSTVA